MPVLSTFLFRNLSFPNMSDKIDGRCPPSPTITADSAEASNDSDQTGDANLYQSLEAAIQHPSCVSNAWLDTIGDLNNNPHELQAAPYNDGSLHWVDKTNHLLNMAFPAVLDLQGKYAKLRPYFSLTGDQAVKVWLL